ncbi:DUF1463 family protein [Borrelia hispanica]|uniref:DUF1463 family protein n=1 Tax=Borrelia hispanica TaxID=40835 RepID=UPI0004655C64|nr:DUF1463 family protein [Borrelia hispanica]
MDNAYQLEDVYFSVNGTKIIGGKLELSSEPTTRATFSNEDKGVPVVSFRDPRTIVYIFNIEVSIGSYEYGILTDLSSEQFYTLGKNKNEKFLSIVFNDRIQTKIISNYAVFTEEPSRSYSAESEKVTFEIRAMNCTRTIPNK